MRTSKDLYKLITGEIIELNQNQEPPAGSTLFTGYDYNAQRWMYQGKPDTRTLEELQASINKTK